MHCKETQGRGICQQEKDLQQSCCLLDVTRSETHLKREVKSQLLCTLIYQKGTSSLRDPVTTMTNTSVAALGLCPCCSFCFSIDSHI